MYQVIRCIICNTSEDGSDSPDRSVLTELMMNRVAMMVGNEATYDSNYRLALMKADLGTAAD